MNPQKLIEWLVSVRLTRYGLVFASGVLCGSWAGQQWPEQTAAFWAMPATSLGLAIAGLWLSQNKRAKDRASVAEQVQSALYTPVPSEGGEAKAGDVVPRP